jgi:hypothetical protein
MLKSTIPIGNVYNYLESIYSMLFKLRSFFITFVTKINL